MKISGPFPFNGSLVWLTAEQGGRRSGPPTPPYAATAYVPPANVADGLASFVLQGFDPAVLQSPAVGRWLAVANDGVHAIRPGTVVVVTEGPQPVAYFHVEQIAP